MATLSLWDSTLTFFPQFLAALREHPAPQPTTAVIGASDGKFVLPLVHAGHNVLAVERDNTALHGGVVDLPDGARTRVPGLTHRLAADGIGHRVTIRQADFLDAPPEPECCHAVWTSCSWHYSVNHRRPLSDFVATMQAMVKPGGLFGAEFMMPVEPRHDLIEHYTTPNRLAEYFAAHWRILLTLQTSRFVEQPHIGQPFEHEHRMGLLIARREARAR
ncbi:class I SAM-dependent methyltransferase [Actinocrinis puniceicyclus]|uniref:Class I SAM-dependent methyltransferase n=1 Tax=Actinocrinis puniceicyclus TaxID=977794 RepID=A0A8J7WRL7_9ACTN|nr:class I SAM-dependent methyltransferase [Actinocrinis puniceicyclus]MBS2966243.1 class I SAM-dependent methyltransferase [Actinocrinis puniceicyclus]